MYICESYHPIIIRCFSWTIDEIDYIDNDFWRIKGEEVDSPLNELDDLRTKLKAKLDNDRLLRQKLSPNAILALPLVTHADYERKFGNTLDNASVLWMENNDIIVFAEKLNADLSENEWRTVRSVAQGIRVLRQSATGQSIVRPTLGEAITN